MKANRILTPLLIILLFSACNRGTVGIPEEFDYGKTENGVYTNTFFDFKLTLPTDWDLRSQAEAKEIMDKGMENMKGGNMKKEVMRRSAEINTAQLITLFHYTDAEGMQQGSNPSFLVLAENTSRTGMVNTGADYLDILARQLDQLNMKFKKVGSTEKTEIGGMEFYYLNSKGYTMGASFNQRYYATVKNGFSLVIILTWIDSGEEEDLMDILNSMEPL